MGTRRLILPLMLVLIMCTATGCPIVNPTTNPDGTAKVKPITLTQRTTQYREVYLAVETSINDLYEGGKISNSVMTTIIAPAVLSARQALKDMTDAAKAQNATNWGVYEKGFLGALDGLIAQRRAAEASTSPATRPTFSPP